MSVKKKLMRNTIYNYSIRFWGILINFLLFPVIVYFVGPAENGIYLFVVSLVGYFGILDLGIPTSLVKFVAEYHTKKDEKRLDQVVNTAFFIFLGIGVIGSIIIFVIGTFVLQYFNLNDYLSKARALAYLVAVFFVFQFSLNIFRNVLAGLQRYDILAKIMFVMSIFNIITTITVLIMGYGVVELVFYTFSVSSMGYIITAVYALKCAPFLEIKRIHYSKSILRKLFSLSMWLLLLWLFIRMIYFTDTLVIIYFLGPAMVTIYVAAWKIYQIPIKMVDIVADAMVPASSELDALQKKRALKMLFIRTSKYAFALIVMLAVPTLFLSKQILTFYVGWAGEDFELYFWVINILIFSIFFDFFNHIAHPILIGMNKVKVIVGMYGVVAILNLILSIILVQTMDLNGVALGTLVPFIITAPIIVVYYLRVFEVDWKMYTKSVILKVISMGGVAAAVLFILVYLYVPTNPIVFAAYFALSISIFLSLFYYLGLEKYEKEDIKLIINKIRKVMEKDTR